MALLDQKIPELTTAEKQIRVAQRIKQSAAQSYKVLCQIQKEGIRTVWNNPQGLTPQEVLDSIGTDAGKIFAFHGHLTETIVNIASLDGVAPDIALPTKEFKVNEDGTITVGTEAYKP
jgi:hypothetical protein